jgi:hypothetical protein
MRTIFGPECPATGYAPNVAENSFFILLRTGACAQVHPPAAKVEVIWNTLLAYFFDKYAIGV